MEETSLADRLAALRAYQEPVSSVKLLRILAPFLYALSFPAPDNSDRVQTIHYLMDTWYVKQAKSDTISNCGLDLRSGSCCCFHCGSVLGVDRAGIALSCGQCQAEIKLYFFFLADLLEHCYSIPHSVTVKIISDYLEKRASYDDRYYHCGYGPI